VGKTAFMEACYFASSKGEEERKDAYLIIDFNRNPISFLENKYNLQNKFQFSKFIINSIDVTEYIPFTILADDEKKAIYQNINYISLATNFNERLLINSLGEIKLLNLYAKLRGYLENIFDIQELDIIRENLMLKQNNRYQSLSNWGDGIKHFISMLFSLLINKNSIIYLDEIENGIHYTNLDKLWEIILTIAKQQNVQVFATTHSKECIESYARVAKKLEDDEVRFISLYKNKENKIQSLIFDRKAIDTRLELGLDNR